MNTNKKFSWIIFLILTNIVFKVITPLSIIPMPTQKAGLSFFNIVETKKKQLEDLENKLIVIQTERSNSNLQIDSEIKEIEKEISETKEDIDKKENTEEEIALLSRKSTILNDRKLNLANLKESWSQTEEIIKKQILLLQKTVKSMEFEESSKKEIKLAYTWKELQKIQIKISELILKINDEKKKKENFKQQLISEKENLYSLQKQSEIKNNVILEYRKKITDFSPETSERSVKTLKSEISITKQEIENFSGRIKNSNVILKTLEQEIAYRESEIEYKQHKLSEFQNIQLKAKKRLILDIDDIETTKEEWKNETQKLIAIKEELNKQRENKRNNRNKILYLIEKTKTELIIEKNNNNKKTNSKIILLESIQEKLKSEYSLLNLELKLINLKKTDSEFQENLKKLQYEIINTHYRLTKNNINLDQTLQTFISQKEIVLNNLNNLRDEDKKSNDLSRGMYRNLEEINNKIQKLIESKKTILKHDNKTYNETMNNLQQAKEFLDKQRHTNLEYSAKNLELIQKQENEILNQYNFIIEELETKKISLNIWERSPKAISPDELQKAFLSAEIFVQSLFLETPRYFGPISIIKNLNEFEGFDFLKILLLILLLIISFLGIKKGLQLAQLKFKNFILEYKNKTSYLYFNLLETIINFIIKHLKVLWTWIFIVLHIIFKSKSLFFCLSSVINPYSIAIFYLASIPILVYLSQQLLLDIKKLNEKLSYIFFAEKLQNKFIALLNVFLYSSSIIMPLRQAFLNYTTGATHFPDVLLAAYSLILVVVLLFFFSKEDVLKLIPSTNNFFLWLKKKIESHYYPVFIFIMGLLIISNPYIGYSNLAWYLAFVVPLSILSFDRE